MAFDQNITYRVNIDDSNFQAKLTQLRASMDSTIGGGGGLGGSANFGYGMMNVMAGGGGSFGTMGLGGGFADFGGQVRPVTFTPPAIAMQPHFGMFQIQQTLGQAGLVSAFGPAGIGMMQLQGGLMNRRDPVPANISYGEYIGYSSRAFADRMGANATAFAGAGLSLGMNIAGGAAGSAIGGMIGGGMIGGLVGGIAGGMAVGAIGSAVAERAADNLGMQSSLAASSFRFYQGSNVDPLTGRGFNRQDRFNIATGLMRQEANDARFNTADYRQILEGGAQMDLFSGTRDADDFGKKFKDLVATVKTVTSTLHTSLKEGLETIRGMRDMGVTDPGAQQAMVMRSETLGRMSGRTGMEMMAIGQTGAEMFRGTGIAMQRGFELNQQNTALVRQMLNQGAISRETVAQAGGELALAQQMTGGALAGFQTLQGRGALMAAFNPATGNLDPNMVSKMMSGDAMSIMQGAAGTMANPANLFKFQAHQEELISKLSPMEMQMFGAAQRMASARTLQRAFGGDLKDIFMAESKRQGIGIEQINTEIGMLTMDPNKLKDQILQQNMNLVSQQNLESARDSYLGPKFLSNAFTRAVTQPLSESTTRFGNRVATLTEDVTQNIRSMFGGNIDARQMNASAVNSAKDFMQNEVNYQVRRAAETAGRPLTETEARAAAEGAAKKAVGGGSVIDLSETGLTDYVGRIGGGQGTTQGDLLRAAAGGKTSINGVAMQTFKTKEEMEAAATASGQTLYSLGKTNGQIVAISADDLGGVVDRRRKMQVSKEEVDKQRLVIEKDQNITRALQGAEKLDLNTIGKMVVGNFSADKYMSGGYGKDVYARIRAVAEVSHDSDLINQIDDLQDTSKIERLRNESTGKASDLMRDKRANIKKSINAAMGGMLFDSEGTTKLKDLLRDDASASKAMQAIAMLDRGDKKSREEATQTLVGAGTSRQEALRIIDEMDAARKDPAKAKALRSAAQNAKEFLSLANSTATDNAVIGGSDLGASGGIGGSLNATQMQSLMQMSKALETQIKMLMAMQEQLSGSFKTK